MIVFYLESSDGEVCKCEFISWLYVNYALLSLYEMFDKLKVKLKVIDEKRFKEVRKGRAGFKIGLARYWPDDEKTHIIASRNTIGYYTKFKF